MTKLLVGAGKACINPTADMFPVPEKHQDWGRIVEPQVEVYDDMHVRAIAIDNGKEKLMFVSFDLSGIPMIPELPQIIAEETGFPSDNIILCATHNHTGVKDHNMTPFARLLDGRAEEFCRKYKEIETKQSIAAAKQAVAAMRPAKYGFGETQSRINVNRDLHTNGGYWIEARNMEGFSDHTLACVKFVDEQDRLIAVLLNHPTHSTCCYMLSDVDGKRKTSGNFTGITSRFVEDHYGGDVVAIWTSGAAGNQNPLLSHGMQYEYPNGFTSAVNYPDGVGYMQMEFMGRWHGSDCIKNIESITKYSNNMPIAHCRKSVDLPRQEKILKEGMPYPFRMGGYGVYDVPEEPKLPDIPERVPVPDNPVELRMQLVMLGDVAIVCAGAELYSQLGVAIKEASPYKKTFVITHTETKDHMAGYILDKTSKDNIVFQAFSYVQPGSADELIIDCAEKLFDDVLKK